MKAVFITSVGSHLNATIGLAKQLVEIGWEVSYAGTPKGVYNDDIEGTVRNFGFAFDELNPFQLLDISTLGVKVDEKKHEFLSLAYNLTEGDE